MKRFLASLALVATLAAALPALVSAQPNPYWWGPNYRWNAGTYARNRVGWISSTSKWQFTMRNGQVVFLHQGTILRPTGVTLQSGMHVRIRGYVTTGGNINADEVDLVRGQRYWYNGAWSTY